jgi:hypothetical protein
MVFRIVLWDVLPCKIIVDRRFRDAWRQYAPLKRRSTVILHCSTSQKTILNILRFSSVCVSISELFCRWTAIRNFIVVFSVLPIGYKGNGQLRKVCRWVSLHMCKEIFPYRTGQGTGNSRNVAMTRQLLEYPTRYLKKT